MSQTVERNITGYIEYFRQQLDSVEQHCPKSQDGELHSRILYIAILDAISRTVGAEEGNHDRVVRFVEGFCGWPECSRISLSHLYRLVENKLQPEMESLRNFALERMSKWIRGDKILLVRDPAIAEVKEVWPHHDGKPIAIDRVRLDRLKHSELLYSYRNRLIHEFRIAGRHVQLWDDDEPYYAYLGEYASEDSPEIKHTWELQYTAKFFRRLSEAGLSGLDTYLRQNRIDPYDRFDWGNYWIQELNM